MGSMGLVAAARAAYAVTKDPADPQRRLFLPLKNNIGKDTTGYAFRVESAATGDGIETSRIVWEQDPVTTTAEEAMTSAGATDDRTDIDDAKNFLNNLLAHGPVSSKQIRAEAEGAGYSWTTIKRAKKALGIEAVKRPDDSRALREIYPRRRRRIIAGICWAAKTRRNRGENRNLCRNLVE